MRSELTILVLSSAGLTETQRWVDYFVDRGDAVHLASIERSIGTRATEHRARVPSAVGALRYPMLLPWVRRRYGEIRPDIVVGQGVATYGFLGALLQRPPFVCLVRAADLRPADAGSRFHRWRARFTLERTDLALSDAAAVTRRIAEMGIQPRRIEMLSAGVDTGRLRPLEEPKPEPATVLCVGHAIPLRTLDLFVRSIPEILRRTKRPFRVRMVGQGREQPRLMALAGSLDVSRFVTFAAEGQPEESLVNEVRQATVCVLLSGPGASSIALLRAMACGAPPIAADTEENRDWITPGENGILVGLERSEELADGIVELLDDPDLAARFAERNQRLVRSRGDWAKNMERTRRLLLELTPRRRR